MAMFGSTSPFGASSSTPFGGAGTSSSPFGTSGQSNPFGANQPANPFGAKPFASSPFGGQTGGSLFGSGTATGVFGSTQQPAFGGSTPAFGGSSSSPAFGSTSTPFGSGTPAFGQKPTTSFGGFGTTPAQSNPFGTFGQTQPAFGSQPFGSTPAFGPTSSPTPAFGSAATPAFGSSSAPAFGASSTPAFGASTSSPFGSSTPAFGATSSVFGQSTPAFGASSSPAFGSTPFGGATSSPFGAPQSGSAFGATPAPAYNATGFGASFGGQRVGSRVVPYGVTNDPDVGVGGQVGKFMSISAMPAYNSKSPEELRWDDYQANDKGGSSSAGQQTPAGGIFGNPTQSPFGSASAGAFGQQASAPNPFAGTSTSSIFGAKPANTFGGAATAAFGAASSTPAFGQSFSPTQSPFGAPATAPLFGQASNASFNLSQSPFGSSSGAGFGANTFGSVPPSSSVFGTSTPGFTSSAFTNLSLPTNTGSSAPFGSSSVFGQTQPAGSLFATPLSQGGVASTPFGSTSTPAFTNNIFSGGTPSIFGSTKPAGLTQSPSPSPFTNFAQTTPAQSSFTFPTFPASQSGGASMFTGSAGSPFGQNAFAQPQPANNLMMPQPVSNPFGTLPAMPQMSIGRSAGSGPSVQYGISSMPVSDKPAQVRTTSLLTPRHITQRSKIRMHARRYHPKKDSPKVSFFSDGEEVPSIPKADVLFVPRENPRALFIRQVDQSPVSTDSLRGPPDPKELVTPVQRSGVEAENDQISNGPPPPSAEGSMDSWPIPNLGENPLQTPPLSSKPTDKGPTTKSMSKMNGVREEHNHRGNGYISITGHRAGEAAIAYEHGADIEALMPKLRHSDYFTEPRIQELAAKERAESGYCRRVHNFVVGRKGFGSVKFLGDTDVRRLDLESIIQFNRCEVLVYMDESKKPPTGQGLNKPAEVSLLNVKCVDKKTGQHFTEGPEAEKFQRRLKKKTEEQGAQFIAFDAVKGEWRFEVKHFSRYALDDSEGEEEGFHPDPGNAPVLSGTDMMEGVEVDAFENVLDIQEKFAEDDLVNDEVELDEDEVGYGDVHIGAPHAALPHSLPSHLRLDPLKMQQMRALFFPLGEDAEDPAVLGLHSKPYQGHGTQAEYFSKPESNAHKGAREGEMPSAWPHRTPWKGGPTKQMRLTPHKLWKPSVPFSPDPTEIQTKQILQALDFDSSPFESGAVVALEDGADPDAYIRRTRNVGFALEFDCKSESIAVDRCDHIVDAGLFLGRSFRAGWSPSGVLVHSGRPAGIDTENVVLSSQLCIQKVALDGIVRDKEGIVVEDLVELQYVSPLRIHMSMSKVAEPRKELASDSVNLRNLVCNRSDLSSICDEYEDLIHKQHGVKRLVSEYQLALRHQVIVWQLVDVLFSDILPAHEKVNAGEDLEGISEENTAAKSINSFELLIRRAEFSRWLQTSVSHLVQEDLQLLDEGNEMQEIFTLLTGRKVDAAVLKATIHGDIRLACLLSQAGASVKSRSDISTQLLMWGSDGLDQSLIEDERMSVFKLLAGDIWGALDNHDLDWKRFLGLIMWYQLSPDTDLSVIIGTYQKFIGDNKSFLPIPMYVEEGDYNDLDQVYIYDASYYLMLLHATGPKGMHAEDLEKMFSSASTTFDKLDHRMAWHQQGLLQALGALEPFDLYDLHMNFVAQLLAVGLCHWAIYVVLHIPFTPIYPGYHERVVKYMLSQYCEIWSKSQLQQDFLDQELGIPAKWLHEALAVYFHYVGDAKQELEHLIKSFQWHQAQTLYMTAVSAVLFMSSEHREVWNFASQLEANAAGLEDWDLGAGIFFDFYELKNRMTLENDAVDELDTIEKKASSCKAFFTRLNESERLWKKKGADHLRMAYLRMADELATLLLSVIHAQARNPSEGFKGFNAILDAPVLEHVRACHIQGAVSAFTTWLSETVV